MAYDSVEGMLYPWFIERGLFPGKLGIGDVQDLAEKVTEMIMPFRNFYRATEGWEGYDFDKTRVAARKAEQDL